jgi:hypothetical protein
MGTQVLIPPDAGKRATPRRGWNGGRCAFMRNVLVGELGGGLYRKRKAMVDPVFAQTKHNRRISQFQRRGRSAARRRPRPQDASMEQEAGSPDDSVAQLTQLKSLLDSGALTQEEFDAEKQEVIGA